MHSRIFLLPLLALGAALAPGAAAQNGGNDVPRELVHALLFGAWGQPGPSIVVGRLPEEIPAGLLPPGANVVGGLSMSGAGTAVLTVPQPPAEAVSGWRAQLERAGWNASLLRFPADVAGFGLCGPDHALLAATASARPRGGGSLLRLTVATAALSASSCVPSSTASDARPVAATGDLPFPQLHAPEGVPWSGGGGGSPEEGLHDARLHTARAPAELAAFYAAQLRQAGWNVTAPRADAAGATAWGEMRDAGGRPWRALLAVLPVAAEERAVVVRVVGASSQPPLVVAWNPVARATGAPVPLELVRTLFTHPGADGEEPLEFVVGRLPPVLASAPLPAGARVVGGVDRGGRATGAVEVAGDLRQALDGYAAVLEGAGWRPQVRWVFVAPKGPAPPMEYCDPDGRFVRVGGTPLRDGGGYVTLETDGSGRNPNVVVEVGPADRCYRPPTDWKDIPLPVLGAPEGAELHLGPGGGGGSAHAWGATVRLRTTLAPAAVVAHYAALLRQAGWSILPPAGDPDAAAATGELRDARGRTWRALLAAMAVAPGERDVLVRVVRPER
ncbi:MAG: hypothetical protein ACJ8GN_19770 [Longimicrobiaceae bacterium]